MPYLSWNPYLELAHEQLDDEHKGMLERINRLFDAVFCDPERLAAEHGSADRTVCIEAAVAALQQTAAEHFRSEELLMLASDFPARENHAEQHRELLAQLQGFATHFHATHADSVPHTVRFLREWFEFHVDTYDRALVRWLNTGQPEAGAAADAAAAD